MVDCSYRQGEMPLATKGMNQMATITPKEFAAKVGSDGRTVRKFLRSAEGLDAKVGKGSRWAIESKQVASLTKRFNRWVEAKSPAPDEAPDEG